MSSQNNWAYWIVGQTGYGIPYAKGMPGVAKTTTVTSLADSLGLQFISYELSKCAVEDLSGIPFASTVTVAGVERKCMELLPDKRLLQAMYEPCVILFDEFGSVSHSIQAAALKLMADGVGEHSLAFCAGNPVDQAAAGVDLSPPMVNRLCVLDWEIDEDAISAGFRNGLNFPAPKIPILPQGWKEGIDHWGKLVDAFHSDYPTLLAEFPTDVTKQSDPFPSPRSWANLVAAMAAGEAVRMNDMTRNKMVHGFVGTKAGTQFINWVVEQSLPDPETFLADPQSLRLPTRGDICAAIMGSIINAVIRNNTGHRWEAAGDCIEVAFDQKQEFAAAVFGKWLKHQPEHHLARERNGRMEALEDMFNSLRRDKSLQGGAA